MSQRLSDTAPFVAPEDFASRFFVGSSPAINVTYGGASDIGNVRDNNEDHFAVIHRFRSQHMLLSNLPRENVPAFRDEAFVFVVTDGMGGAAAGELASRFVMEEAWDLSGQASSWVMRIHDISSQQLQERLDAYASRMHEKLIRLSKDDPKLDGMGTTWTSAYVVGWDAVLAHVGDSRAYLYRDGELKQLTRDHTLAQELEDRGVARENTERFRNVLTNSLGGKHSEAIADVQHLTLEHDDRLLLCTDGLSDQVDKNMVVQILKKADTPQSACDMLISAALKAGGKDNITAIVAAFRRAE